MKNVHGAEWELCVEVKSSDSEFGLSGLES